MAAVINLNATELQQLAQEQLKARYAINPDDLLDLNFPQQADFVRDPARFKALFCTRRAAKSYSGGLALVRDALSTPGANCLFVGLTRESAKGIIWKDVLLTLNRKHKLGAKFNKSELTMTFPNGSVIWVTGVDVDEEEMNKLLGRKYKAVVIDEASMYSVDLRNLVYGVLEPAMSDGRGTIYLSGTSSNITKGLFYDITTGVEPGWKLFTWTAHDNPHVATQWQETLDNIEQNRPLYMQTAQYQQWYLNRWVVDEAALIYKYKPEQNSYISTTTSTAAAKQWEYVLGVDLGYEDDSAFVLCKFNSHDKILFVEQTYKKQHMDITDVANRIKEFQAAHSIFMVVIDGANKQAVEEIQKRHGISLRAADKTGKADFIQIMNDEFIQGKIKLSSACTELVKEYKSLVWVLDGERIREPRKENPNCSNHLCDAALYAWRFCYQFLSEQPEERKNVREHWIEYSQQLAEANLERQIAKQQAEESGNIFEATVGLEQNDVLSYHLNRRKTQ